MSYDFSEYPPTVDENNWGYLLDHGLLTGESYIIVRNGDGTFTCINGRTKRHTASSPNSNASTLVSEADSLIGIAGGGSMLFGPGYFPKVALDSTHHYPLRIQGAGRSVTRLGRPDNVPCLKYDGYGTDVQWPRLTVKDLSIGSPNTWEDVGYDGSCGIHSVDVWQLLVDNVEVLNCQYGFRMQCVNWYHERPTLRHIWAEGAKYGIWFNGRYELSGSPPSLEPYRVSFAWPVIDGAWVYCAETQTSMPSDYGVVGILIEGDVVCGRFSAMNMWANGAEYKGSQIRFGYYDADITKHKRSAAGGLVLEAVEIDGQAGTIHPGDEFYGINMDYMNESYGYPIYIGLFAPPYLSTSWTQWGYGYSGSVYNPRGYNALYIPRPSAWDTTNPTVALNQVEINGYLDLWDLRLGDSGVTSRTGMQHKYSQSITQGVTQQVINLPFPYMPNTNYGVVVTPNWGTSVYVDTKTTTTFIVHFGTTSPPGATIDFFVWRGT